MSINVQIDRTILFKQLPLVLLRTKQNAGFAYLKNTDSGLGIGLLNINPATSAGGSATQIFIAQRITPPSTGYKSIKWKAQVLAHEAPSSQNTTDIYPIGLEDAPGFKNAIAIVLQKDTGGTYTRKFVVRKDGSEVGSIDLSDVDFTQLHEFEIKWYPDKVELYIDGSLKDTVNDSPTTEMNAFMEVNNGDTNVKRLEVIGMIPYPQSVFDIIAQEQ